METQIQFDPIEKNGPVMIIIGKRGSGKSFFVRDVCYRLKDNVKRIVVMSGTEKNSPFFADFIPRQWIVDDFNNVIAQKIVVDQTNRCVSQHQSKKYGGAQQFVDNRLVWIIDDCMYDDEWIKSKLMRMMFCNGRHIKIFLLITMQYAMGITPLMRENVDFVVILKAMGGGIQKIYDQYACGVFESFQEFKTIFNQVTVDYTAMVIHQSNNSSSSSLQNYVFWYKSDINGPSSNFKMGTREDWMESEQLEREERGTTVKRKLLTETAEYEPGILKRPRTNINVLRA